VALGRSRGFVTTGDVTAAIDSAELARDALDGVARVLADEGIEVLDAPIEEETDTKLPETDDIVKGVMLTRGGAVVHPNFLPQQAA